MEQLQKLWTGILDTLSKLVIPDWGALIALLPVFLAAGVVLWLVMTVRGFAVLGPRQRGRQYIPVAPAGLHAPGPSFAPAFGALGTALFVFGLVLGGGGLILGLGALILTLIYWLREFMVDYDHVAGATTLPVPIEHAGPPAGVHVPGPSFLPLASAVATALLFVGIVVGGWVLIGALVCLVVGLLGWLRAARAEYRLTEEADRTGHLRNEPAPGFPTRMFVFFTIVMLAAFTVEGGILPPRASTAGTPGAGPAASGAIGSSAPASVAPTPAGPAADITITGQTSLFATPNVSGTADKPFTIAFDNEDQGVPHNIHIKKPDGSEAFKGDLVTGVATKVYQVPALPAGTYPFACDVHPSMTGTLTLK